MPEYTAPKFDIDAVKQNLQSLVPNGFPQLRMQNGTYDIMSYWEKGELNRLDIDTQNIGDLIGIKTAQDFIKNILVLSKRYRHKFTGHLKLSVKVENGEIISLYKEDSRHLNNSMPELNKIIPASYTPNPFLDLKNGLFSISTRWKGGDMKEAIVDTKLVKEDLLIDIETGIELLAQKIRCNRKFFSGRRSFVIRMKGGNIKTVIYSEGNFIINKRTTNNKKYQK